MPTDAVDNHALLGLDGFGNIGTTYNVALGDGGVFPGHTGKELDQIVVILSNGESMDGAHSRTTGVRVTMMDWGGATIKTICSQVGSFSPPQSSASIIGKNFPINSRISEIGRPSKSGSILVKVLRSGRTEEPAFSVAPFNASKRAA